VNDTPILWEEDSNYDISITIVNLMPQKQRTEWQLVQLLWNTNLKIRVILTLPQWYTSNSTPKEYFSQYYSDIENVMQEKVDACIITWTPVEHLNFEEVKYWEAMEEIFNWTKNQVHSTLHICWGAMAWLYHHYGIWVDFSFMTSWIRYISSPRWISKKYTKNHNNNLQKITIIEIKSEHETFP
jgi:homoserine O-succinyltransferase